MKSTTTVPQKLKKANCWDIGHYPPKASIRPALPIPQIYMRTIHQDTDLKNSEALPKFCHSSRLGTVDVSASPGTVACYQKQNSRIQRYP